MSVRDDVIKTIKSKIVPELRNSGFKGTYPHFKRIDDESGKVDFLSFQFNKWGGSFIIELAVAYPCKGKTGNYYSLERQTPECLNKSDIGFTKERIRIEPKKGKWFEYDEINYEHIVDIAFDKLMKNIKYYDKPYRFLK